jgi:hypothetical protein
MAHFFAGGARGLVEAQRGLDDRGRESLARWGEDGLPPVVLTWSTCRLRLPVRFGQVPKRGAAGRTAITVAPCRAGRGTVAIGFRYLFAVHDEGDT